MSELLFKSHFVLIISIFSPYISSQSVNIVLLIVIEKAMSEFQSLLYKDANGLVNIKVKYLSQNNFLHFQ